jgi:N-succinyldiaminopimelate aminotransferase
MVGVAVPWSGGKSSVPARSAPNKALERTAHLQAGVEEWQRRRDILLEELRDFVVIPPHSGWSLLLDVSPLGLDGVTASKRLLELGKIAATPMLNWGSVNSNKYVRFVFANEPVHRLRGIGKRVQQALT